MKLYQVIQENWAFLGIRRDQPFFNEKSIRTFLLYGFAINSASLFLFFNANTFLEYTQNIYVNCAVLVICAVFTITLFQREKLFKFIDYMERHIDQSEYPFRTEYLVNFNRFYRFQLTEIELFRISNSFDH